MEKESAAIWKRIGGRLKSARKMKGESLREAAKGLEISHEGLNKYEKGMTPMSSSKLIKFSNYYGVPVDYFSREPIELVMKEIRFFKLKRQY